MRRASFKKRYLLPAVVAVGVFGASALARELASSHESALQVIRDYADLSESRARQHCAQGVNEHGQEPCLRVFAEVRASSRRYLEEMNTQQSLVQAAQGLRSDCSQSSCFEENARTLQRAEAAERRLSTLLQERRQVAAKLEKDIDDIMVRYRKLEGPGAPTAMAPAGMGTRGQPPSPPAPGVSGAMPRPEGLAGAAQPVGQGARDAVVGRRERERWHNAINSQIQTHESNAQRFAQRAEQLRSSASRMGEAPRSQVSAPSSPTATPQAGSNPLTTIAPLAGQGMGLLGSLAGRQGQGGNAGSSGGAASGGSPTTLTLSDSSGGQSTERLTKETTESTRSASAAAKGSSKPKLPVDDAESDALPVSRVALRPSAPGPNEGRPGIAGSPRGSEGILDGAQAAVASLLGKGGLFSAAGSGLKEAEKEKGENKEQEDSSAPASFGGSSGRSVASSGSGQEAPLEDPLLASASDDLDHSYSKFLRRMDEIDKKVGAAPVASASVSDIPLDSRALLQQDGISSSVSMQSSEQGSAARKVAAERSLFLRIRVAHLRSLQRGLLMLSQQQDEAWAASNLSKEH